MPDDENLLLCFNCAESCVVLELVLQLAAQLQVRALRHHTLLVQHCENAAALLVDQLYAVGVVWVGEGRPRNPLAPVQSLLTTEDEVVEKLLQTLVSEVYAELLKRVQIETLESEYVENSTEKLNVVFEANRSICIRDNVKKCCSIQCFTQSVSVILRFSSLQRNSENKEKHHDGYGGTTLGLLQ